MLCCPSPTRTHQWACVRDHLCCEPPCGRHKSCKMEIGPLDHHHHQAACVAVSSNRIPRSISPARPIRSSICRLRLITAIDFFKSSLVLQRYKVRNGFNCFAKTSAGNYSNWSKGRHSQVSLGITVTTNAMLSVKILGQPKVCLLCCYFNSDKIQNKSI